MPDSIWTTLGKIILSFLGNEAQGKIGAEISIPLPVEAPAQINASESAEIKWDDPLCPITTHFLVGDAIALHSWNRLANESDGLTEEIKSNIVTLCNKMEEIRKVLNCPINVHCIFRSVQYNEQVLKSLPKDVHSMGLAIDMDCNGHHTIQEVKDILIPLLEQYNVRLEKGTTTWIHLDQHSVGPSGRYFTA